MATTLTNTHTVNDLEQNSNNLENIVGRLYTLKNRFESTYYSGQSWKKYERAREFTIRINLALYHAHKMKRKIELFEHNFPLSNQKKAFIYCQKFNQISGRNYNELEKEIDFLGKELIELMQ